MIFMRLLYHGQGRFSSAIIKDVFFGIDDTNPAKAVIYNHKGGLHPCLI
jgi:hypothetical protein